tara:strand:- start:214 stop:336 length:123 start_codon:yes stop_codon:yes gene_type:complete
VRVIINLNQGIKGMPNFKAFKNHLQKYPLTDGKGDGILHE